MKLKLRPVAIALGAAASLFVSTVSAAQINLPDTWTQLSDNSAESLINAPGTTGTTLDVGDRLRGQFNVESLEGLFNGVTVNGPVFGGNELTGIFDIVVLSKAGGPGAWAWTFGASGNLGTPGAAVEMYYDITPDYTRIGCGSIAACEATASDGSLWAALSSAVWSATAVTDDIVSIGTITPPALGGGYNAALNFLVNNTGYIIVPQLCLLGPADVCPSGSLLGTGGANRPYQSYDNVDFTIRVSPLQMDQAQAEGLLICAEYGQPVTCAPEAAAGTTAPITLAGLVAQENAAILAHITLAQIFRPGAPVLYGTVSTTANMRYGTVALGSPETGLITAASAQMARYYGLPIRSVGGSTDSKREDLPAGFERMGTLLPAVLAGVNLITCAGTLDSTMLESHALLMLDDEI